MKQRLIVCILTVTALFGDVTAADGEDVLGRILQEVGLSRADLGYEPKGFWARFPLDIPYRLTSFDDLFAEPIYLYDYSRIMANSVGLYLDPAYADTADDGLYKLVYNLGVDRKLGGFRSYSANLIDIPDTVDRWHTVMAKIDTTVEKDRLMSRVGDAFDVRAERLREEMAVLPDSVEGIVADLLVNLFDAIHWRNLAFRKCDTTDMRKAQAIRDLAMTQNDGQVYYPELDDLAATIDWSSLHYAALKTAAACERASFQLRPWTDRVDDYFEVMIETPYGEVAVLSPHYKNEPVPPPREQRLLRANIDDWMRLEADSALLVIDFGRDMVYEGAVAATTSLTKPVSVVIDLGGEDYYGYDRKEYPPSAGVGLMGVGLVIDESGDDHYHGSVYAQGAGLFGVGVLLDRSGNDEYEAELSAQGCGYFGIGLCLDGEGDDSFYLYGDGQGMGGVGGGIGVLSDFSGDDEYTGEADPEVFDRADYHSEGKINGNNVQGAGFGRRGDITDGHSWAGGLGAIIDMSGNDHYYSGNWSLGIAYWFSTGIAYDGGGDDVYESCYFTQGSGAHYCNGILIDENGNDRHELYETAGAGLGFGWDFTNAFLINKGGHDVYRAKRISMGLAQIRSNAFLIDVDGDDAYYLGEGTPGLGEASYRKGMDKPLNLLAYFSYATGFGGFIDIGGEDRYVSFTDSTEEQHDMARNDSLWLQPARGDSLFGFQNYGVGVDIKEGAVPELNWWDE